MSVYYGAFVSTRKGGWNQYIGLTHLCIKAIDDNQALGIAIIESEKAYPPKEGWEIAIRAIKKIESEGILEAAADDWIEIQKNKGVDNVIHETPGK